MKPSLGLRASLLVMVALLAGGCGSPEAIKPLTDDEKNEIVEMALAHPEVSKWLDEADVYSTEVGWVVIAWEDSRAVGWYRMDYEDVKDGEPPSDITYVTDDVTINPQLYIRVGEPTRLFISVVFNQDKKEVLAVELQPGRPTAGPTPVR